MPNKKKPRDKWLGSPPRIAYVLGSGGIRGMAHAGALAALEEAGIHPDLIVGCSAGAIAGGLYAAVPSATFVEQVLMEMAPYTRSLRLLGMPSLYTGALGGGFFSLKHLAKFLSQKIPAEYFEQLQIPLIVTATNLSKGTLGVFEGDKEQLIPAICASSAIPGFFQPLKINGDYYGDGAILSSTPIGEAEKKEAQLIIAFNIDNQITIDPPKMHGLFRRSLLIAYMHRGHQTVGRADVVINPKFEGQSEIFASRKQLKFLYNAGKEAAEQMIAKIFDKLADLGA